MLCMLESIQNVVFGKPDSKLIKDGLRAGMGKGGQEAGTGLWMVAGADFWCGE